MTSIRWLGVLCAMVGGALAGCSGGSDADAPVQSGGGEEDSNPPPLNAATGSIKCGVGLQGWEFDDGTKSCVPKTCPAGNKRGPRMECVPDSTRSRVSSMELKAITIGAKDGFYDAQGRHRLFPNYPQFFQLQFNYKAQGPFKTATVFWLKYRAPSWDKAKGVPDTEKFVCNLGSVIMEGQGESNNYWPSNYLSFDDSCLKTLDQIAQDGWKERYGHGESSLEIMASFDPEGLVDLDGRPTPNEKGFFFDEVSKKTNELAYYMQSAIKLTDAIEIKGWPGPGKFDPRATLGVKTSPSNPDDSVIEYALKRSQITSPAILVDAVNPQASRFELAISIASYGDSYKATSSPSTLGDLFGKPPYYYSSANPFAIKQGVTNGLMPDVLSSLSLSTRLRPSASQALGGVKDASSWLDIGGNTLLVAGAKFAFPSAAGVEAKVEFGVSKSALLKIFDDWGPATLFDLETCLSLQPYFFSQFGGVLVDTSKFARVSEKTPAQEGNARCSVQQVMLTRRNEGRAPAPIGAAGNSLSGTAAKGAGDEKSQSTSQSGAAGSTCDKGKCSSTSGMTTNTAGKNSNALTPVDLRTTVDTEGNKTDTSLDGALFGVTVLDEEEEETTSTTSPEVTIEPPWDQIVKSAEPPTSTATAAGGKIKIETTKVAQRNGIALALEYTKGFIFTVGYVEVTIGASAGFGASVTLKQNTTASYPCLGQDKEKCFQPLKDSARSFSDASKECFKRGGRLVEPRSQDQQNAVNTILKNNGMFATWLGGSFGTRYANNGVNCYHDKDDKSCPGKVDTFPFYWASSGTYLGYMTKDKKTVTYSSNNFTNFKDGFNTNWPDNLDAALAQANGAPSWEIIRADESEKKFAICEYVGLKEFKPTGFEIALNLGLGAGLSAQATYGKKDFLGFGVNLSLNVIGITFTPRFGYQGMTGTRMDGSCYEQSFLYTKGTVAITALDGGLTFVAYTPFSTFSTPIFSWSGFTLKEWTPWDSVLPLTPSCSF